MGRRAMALSTAGSAGWFEAATRRAALEAVKLLLTPPGQRIETPMSCGASSARRLSDKPITANFEAA